MQYFNLGCSTVKENSCGVCGLQDYMDILARYHDLGVRHIEYSHPQTMQEDEAAAIEREAARIGLPAWSVHSLSWEYCKNDDDFEQHLRHDAKIGSILGAHVMVFHPMSKADDGSVRWHLYEMAAQIAKEAGLRLAVETGIPTPTGAVLYHELIELVDKISLPNVGICIDSGHSYLRDNKNVDEVVRAVGSRLMSLHLHDNYGTGDDHQAPGVGYIDWYKVIPALKASPYNGPLMLELTDCKKRRTTPVLKDMTVDREILFGGALFRYIWDHC